jgi:2-C-methyl-D-erythritol 2,4-cyclodiphosphate synthase
MIRVGLGRDLHRLVQGRRFLLAGVELPSDRGELGHSDGDVLAHAVTDAVLGAAGLGDIGAFFPPSDPKWKDADSMELLRTAFGKVREQGWRLLNLDCVVTCEKPRLLPYRERIRAALAAALNADIGAIFVKGKTAEGLGPIGEGAAVDAEAVCLLEFTARAESLDELNRGCE